MLNRIRTAALVSALLLSSFSARAALLNPDSNTASTSSIAGVPVIPAMTTEVSGIEQKLQLIGAGLRSKKVALASVKVYVAQAYAQAPTAIIREDAKVLASLANAGTLAIQLKFLRTVEAATVQNSFRDAFFANKIDVNQPEIAAFLKAVNSGGDASEGSTLTIRATQLVDGTEEIDYEDSKGVIQTVTGPAGTRLKVFALWYGIPADSGLTTLKAALLNQP